MSGNNSDQHLGRPDDAENPPTPVGEPGNGDRPTRSITVSIQYSYFNPTGLANLNAQQNENGAGTGEISPVNRPDGALILSFRDVPTSTPQERLESIISIAAELAMRRFSDMMSQPKGITKEQFEQLPSLKVRDLSERQNAVCSICYDAYEDELSNIFKRTREDDLDGRDGLQKKQRSESPVVVPAQEAATQQGGNADQSSNEAEASTYKHSPLELPCGHIFGKECVFKWSQLENSCPLCRHKIVENAPGQSAEAADGAAANQNAEAFERIRQALYNSSPPDQQAEGSNGPADTANGGNELHNFTFSRSGIVLLRPDARTDPAAVPAAVPVTQADNGDGVSASNVSTNESNASLPDSNNNPDSRRIQWIPLPMTAIQMPPTNFNNEAPDTQNSDESAQQDRSPNERLRTILNNIFSVTHAANTLSANRQTESNVAPNVASSGNANLAPFSTAGTVPPSSIPATDSSASSATSSASQSSSGPRRRSFLDHILRITNRHRSRSNNNTTETDSSPLSHPQSANSMFNTGVASYRNQDGQVSTFHVSDGPLPLPPRNVQATRESANEPENETQSEPTSQAHRDAANGNNDTSN